MDFNLIKTKFSSLFQGKDDKFLVVEIIENKHKAAYIKANFPEREIKFIRTFEAPDLKRLFKRSGRLSKYKIILSLDSHLATTIYSSVVLVRDRFKELIDEAELDNLISQAIWKFFDRQRSKVSAKMAVSDLDIVLADVRIRGVKLDGHKVMNPVGFKAKTVEIQFSQTFLLRSFMDSMKEVAPAGEVVFLTEGGTAWSNVIAKSNEAEDFMMAGMFSGKTSVFASAGSQISYLDHFTWGEDNLNGALAGELAIDQEIAQKIMGKYCESATSANFRRRFEGIVSKELQVFANGINQVLKHVDTKSLFIHQNFNLPNVFYPNFKNSLNRAVNVRPASVDIISNNFGFDIKFKHKADSKNSFTFLAGLLEWYLAPQDDKMSQLAKRRVRWLSPL